MSLSTGLPEGGEGGGHGPLLRRLRLLGCWRDAPSQVMWLLLNHTPLSTRHVVLPRT